MTTVSDLGERALISRITARLTMPPWVLVGPGDDAAVLEPERRMLDVITTDALVDGVHFDRRFCPPDAIGHKALAVNLSDLAAMGASPRAALLSLVLPGELPVSDVDALLEGMLALAARHRVAIIGGNIARAPHDLVLDVTAIGSVAPRRVLTRSGARPGDEVYVTGAIGGGLVGLRALQGDAMPREPWAAAQARYLRPEPRVRAGLMLGRNRAATACVDLSDGLADGLRQIAVSSKVGITIEAAALPLDETARRWHAARGTDCVMAALSGGDDYELVFTVRPSHRGRFRAAQRLMRDLPITRIGLVTKESALVVRTPDGNRELPGGFEHFSHW